MKNILLALGGLYALSKLGGNNNSNTPALPPARVGGIGGEKEKYNGWTNYATWRVKLELFDDDYGLLEMFEEMGLTETHEIMDYLKEQTEEMLECDNKLAQSYAQAFVDDVNWYEIAKSIKESN